MSDRPSDASSATSGERVGGSPTSSQEDGTITTAKGGLLKQLGNIKQGYLMKRHRNRKSYSERFLQLDIDRAILTYFQTPGGRERRSSLLDMFKTAGKKVKSPSGQEDFKLLRQLPIEAVECHVVPGENLDCEESSMVLVVSYREVQGPYKPTITRNVFFISKEEDEDQAGQEILEWHSTILTCQQNYHGKTLHRAQSMCGQSIHSTLSEMSCQAEGAARKPPLIQQRQATDDSIAEEALYKCGWVYKKGLASPSRWNARFLLVDNFRLRYFRAPMDALAQNEIPLYYGDWCVRNGMPDMFPEINYPYCFTVKMATREYYFRTDCADTTAAWVETLKALSATHCRHGDAAADCAEDVVPRRKSYESSMVNSIAEGLPARTASVPRRVGAGIQSQKSISIHGM